MAISEGRNPNAVGDILARGDVAKLETLRDLARVSQVSPLYLCLLAIGEGSGPESELLVYQSPEEERLVKMFRVLPADLRYVVLEMCAGAVRVSVQRLG
jgi:hypothetical protein